MSDNWLARISARVSGLTAGALALLLFVGIASVEAQQRGTITGTVTDANTLEPLSGVQVFVPGTDLGSLADEDGTYRITGVPAGEVRVRARLIGYRESTRTVDIAPGETVEQNFELSVSAVSLDEVVVTTTGEQRRRELGNSVSSINAAEEVEKSQTSNIQDLIQGRATGISITRSSGTVGTGSDINVRGTGSISLSNSPLLIIDGAYVSNDQTTGPGVGGQDASRLNDINPDDIENIEVIKGPAATALYGTGASSGVIQITTKRGRSGAAQYTFRAEGSANWDPTDWPAVAYNPVEDPLVPLPFAKDTLYTMNLMEGAPGFEDPFRTGLSQTYGGTVRGGAEGVTYFLSGEFDDQEGNLPNNQFTKFNGRANFSLAPSDEVDISVSTGYTSNELDLPDNDNNSFGYIGNAQLGLQFLAPFRRSDPNTGGEPVQTCALAFELARAGVGELGPLSEANCGDPFLALSFDDVALLQNEQEIERFTGSATGTYRPVEQWTNRVTLGYDTYGDLTRSIVPVTPRLTGVSDAFDGFVFRSNTVVENLTLQGTSAIALELTEDLSSETTVGAQYHRETFENANALGRVFPAGSPSVGNSVTNEGDDFFTENRTAGFFVQEQLGWRDRLFLTPAVRFDDNSAFGENLGLTVYPRLSASYVVSEEEGFPELFESLKLRASYGESGKQPGPNDALALLNLRAATIQGEERLGVFPDQPANPELSPETSREFEAGFDASILAGRLGLEFTYYDQVTENSVVTQPPPPSGGFPGAQFVNIGEITNHGIEAAVDALVVDLEDISWNARVQLSTNQGEITEINAPIIFGLGGSSQRHVTGRPFGSYVTEQIIIDDETGNARVLTCEEDPTDCITDPETGEFQGDNRFLGHPSPEYQGSFSSTVTLFNLVTLYGLLDVSGGHQLFNATEEFRCGSVIGVCTEIYETNDAGDLTAEARRKRFAAAIGSEGPWIEDATYAKIRTVSLRFDLPAQITQIIGSQAANLTISGENLATFTDYTGVDPELNFAGQGSSSSADFLTLPPARRVVASVSVTF